METAELHLRLALFLITTEDLMKDARLVAWAWIGVIRRIWAFLFSAPDYLERPARQERVVRKGGQGRLIVVYRFNMHSTSQESCER